MRLEVLLRSIGICLDGILSWSPAGGAGLALMGIGILKGLYQSKCKRLDKRNWLSGFEYSTEEVAREAAMFECMGMREQLRATE